MSLPCTQRWTRRWPRTQAGMCLQSVHSKCSSIRSSVRSRYVLDGGHGRTSFADSRAVQEIAAERDSDADGHGDGQIRNAEVPPVARRVRGRRRVTGSSRNLHRRASTLAQPLASTSAAPSPAHPFAWEPRARQRSSHRCRPPRVACTLWLCSPRRGRTQLAGLSSNRRSAEACHRSSNTGACSPRGASSERSISCSICWNLLGTPQSSRHGARRWQFAATLMQRPVPKIARPGHRPTVQNGPQPNLHNVVCPVSFSRAPTTLARLFEKDQNRLPELVFHIRLLSCGYD